MTDLDSYSNIYADLAQSAYIGRNKLNSTDRYNFADGLKKSQRQALAKGDAVPFSFPGVKDTAGNDVSRVFLQPDSRLPAMTVAPGTSGGPSNDDLAGSQFNHNLMEDKGSGYQSYVVTDRSRLADSKHACLAVRGSDNWGNPHDLLTDWIENDGVFALANTGIAQSKDAELALRATIAKLPKTVKLDVTGHSLGTMASAQGVAELLKDDPKAFDRIGKVVLWDGPDTTQSLKSMGLSDARIRQGPAGSRIT